MKLSEHIDKDNLHHAYLIEGIHEELFPEIISFLGEGETNITKERFELFTIDDARRLRMRQGETSSDGQKKIFLLSVGFFTREAENALLKVFEEPTPNTHFFVIVPSAAFLLPTLRSRFMVIAAHTEKDGEFLLKGKAFLKLSKAARLTYIADLIEEHKDEDKHDALKGEAIRLLDSIEAALAEEYKKGVMTSQQQFVLKEIWKCKNFMRDRGASTKMLLEYVALVV